MKQLKRILHNLLFPSIRIILLCSVASVIGVWLVTVLNYSNSLIAYCVFAVATYSLIIFSIFAVDKAREVCKKARDGICAHPIGHRYMTDAKFKTQISLLGSLAINVGYTIFKLATGIIFASFWWGAMAIYYLMLSIIRFLLLQYMHLHKEKDIQMEYRSFQLSGILCLILNLLLTWIIYLMIRDNRSPAYPDGIILIIAMYTFYNVTVSIVEAVRYRKYKSPVLSASKIIRLAAALVSMLNLEAAMLSVYGNGMANFKMLTVWTGAGVCTVVLINNDLECTSNVELPNPVAASLFEHCDYPVKWIDVLTNAEPPEDSYNTETWEYLRSKAIAIFGGDVNALFDVIERVNPYDDLLDYLTDFQFEADDSEHIEITCTIYPSNLGTEKETAAASVILSQR